MPATFFPYRVDTTYAWMLRPLRVAASDGVTVHSDGRLVATFGPRSVETALENVASADVDGPHRWFTAIGLRLALTNDGLTFGTNHHRGVSIAFVEKIPRVVGPRDHSMLWVSVADPDGLAEALRRGGS